MMLLGVTINEITRENALKQCLSWLQNTQPVKLVFTPNPEIIVYAQHHPEFKAILAQADLALPDGAGVVWASHGAITERVAGADVMMDLLALANQLKLSIGIVLSPDGLSSLALVSETIAKLFSNIDCQVTTTAFTSTPEIVFIALGAPQQEQWAVVHKTDLAGAKIMMTVGGGIDYLTGRQRRAPVFLQSVKLEWLWRLLTQPRRWQRIITATIIFPYLVLFSHTSPHDRSH